MTNGIAPGTNGIASGVPLVGGINWDRVEADEISYTALAKLLGVAEPPERADADGITDGTCPNAIGQASNDSGHSADMSGNGRDCVRNDDSASENGVRAANADPNDGNAAQDTREKLEADVFEIVKHGFVTYKEIIELLDRQEAITEREVVGQREGQCAQLVCDMNAARAERDEYERLWRAQCAETAQQSADYVAEQGRCAELEAENRRLEGYCKTERNNFEQAQVARDYWRDKLGRVLQRLRDLGCETGSIYDVPIKVELPKKEEGQ